MFSAVDITSETIYIDDQIVMRIITNFQQSNLTQEGEAGQQYIMASLGSYCFFDLFSRHILLYYVSS